MDERQEALDMLTRMRAGDGTAFEELYDRFTPLLFSVALRILGNVGDAEDVIQQTWTQAWRTAPRYDPSRGSVPAWLVNMARSRALDRKRSLVSRERYEGAQAPGEEAGGDPVVALDDRQRHDRVRAALDTLKPGPRQVLEFAYFGGLAQSEIAERIGKPLGTVKTWTRRGLEQLRSVLEEETA